MLNDVIGRISTGVSVNGEDRRKLDGEIAVLKVSCVLRGRFDPEEHKVVLPSEVTRAKEYVKAGSVIVSRANTPDLVGASAYVSQTFNELYLPDKLWQLTAKPTADGRWIAALISADQFRASVRGKATGSSGSMKNISQEAFLSTPVLIPPLSEQRRIGDMLATWDRAIAAAEVAQNRATRLYLGAAARIVRLRGTDMRPLRELLIPDQMEKVVADGPFRALGVRSHGKGTFERVDDLVAQGSDKTLYRVEANRFIVNIVFAWEGAAAITSVADSCCFVSHRFPTFTIKEQVLSPSYFRHVIRTGGFRQLLALASPGGAGRNKTLNRQDLLRFEIHVPPLADQGRIAEMLSAIDRQATKLERYLQCLSTQREALAARLLSGRLRVREAEQPLTAAAG